ncbi:MAG: DUF4830 domain-containing protein [Oscillospiraceae bacterium]|nr:DUF4830 domain-containing protein [Oscillospiraceae bacterium]
MFVFTAKFHRRRAVIFVLLLGALLSAAILFKSSRTEEDIQNTVISAETNEARIAYLTQLGWEVKSEPVEILQLWLPETLDAEPFASYNMLQLSQGFDMTPCCGHAVTRYTYTVTNPPQGGVPCQANLYVCEGALIAGDIVTLGSGGTRSSLAYPTQE